MSKKTRASAAQKRRTQARARDNRVWFVIVGVGAVVVLGAVIAVALASTQPALAEPAAEPVIVSGQPLPAYPDSGTDPALGMLLPTLQGTGLGGEPVSIGPDGRAKAIIILAHWCPHCQAEVPRIVAWLADNLIPNGVDVVALSTGISETRPNYPPSAWLEREGWELPTLNDDAGSSASLALGALNTPGWVFVGADGTVQLRTTGELDPTDFGVILEQLAHRTGFWASAERIWITFLTGSGRQALPMMDTPEIRYARSADVSIAYATVGHGPIGLIFVSG